VEKGLLGDIGSRQQDVMGWLVDANEKLKWALKANAADFDAVVTERTGQRYMVQFTKGNDTFDLAIPRQWIDDCELGHPVPQRMRGYMEWLTARFASRGVRRRRESKRR
jgi:hypothetical protein